MEVKWLSQSWDKTNLCQTEFYSQLTRLLVRQSWIAVWLVGMIIYY